jgi:hypothetical protein
MARKNIFPDHFINPEKKDKDWILQFAKASWDDSRSLNQSMNYHSSDRFREFRDYALGNQSIAKYKNMIQQKDANGQQMESFTQLDFTVLPIIPKFRKIALANLNKLGHNLVAKAIDPLALDQKEDYFAEKQANIIIKEQLSEIEGIEGIIDMESGDPQDIEELEIKKNYGYKHIAAMEAEQGIKLILSNNNYTEIAKKVKEDIFDFGVGGVREFFDQHGKIKVRRVKPQNWITSYSEESNFSDSRYMGEVINLSLVEIKEASGFSNEDMEKIAEKTGFDFRSSENNFQKNYSRSYDDHKVDVLDLEFFSLNYLVNEKRVDKRGNEIVRKGDFEGRKNKETTKAEYQVVYRCKWVVGTDYIYDYGLETNMKRAKNSLRETSLSFHMYAPFNDQMRFFGVVESMMPAADAIQLAWIKLQNFMLRAKPSGIAINLRALENINIGHGGKKWEPLKVLDLFEQTGNYVYRDANQDGEPMGQPVTPLSNQILQEAQYIVGMINSYTQILRDNIGFNEVTDGSTPNPKTLVGVADMAVQSTSNAIHHITESAVSINESLANALLLRMQDAFKTGKVKAYVTALGENTKNFMRTIPTDISMHELSIYIEDAPNAEEIIRYDRKVEMALQSGQITIEDATFLETIDNIKEKSAVLAYRIRKNKENAQKEAERLQMMNGQIQQQSAIVSEEEKRKTLQLDFELKMQLMMAEKQAQMEIERMKQQGRLGEAQISAQGKAETKEIENIGKKEVASINKIGT